MFDAPMTVEDAAALLELASTDELVRAVDAGELRPADQGPDGPALEMAEVAKYKLAQVMMGIGVGRAKAVRYAEAVLGTRFESDERGAPAWVEDESQELFCQVADSQLTRIFLRYRDDGREVEVGAVKPVLLPTTRCEINVSRVVRPLVYRARTLPRK